MLDRTALEENMFLSAVYTNAFIERQFVRILPSEAQKEQHALDLQVFAGYPNLQQF